VCWCVFGCVFTEREREREREKERERERERERDELRCASLVPLLSMSEIIHGCVCVCVCVCVYSLSLCTFFFPFLLHGVFAPCLKVFCPTDVHIDRRGLAWKLWQLDEFHASLPESCCRVCVCKGFCMYADLMHEFLTDTCT
jgi:hypothetical protein